MKKITALITILFISAVSCSTSFIMKDKITLTELLSTKENIDRAENPAESLLLKNDLAEKIIVLENLKVKDIIPSTHVDYDFCILSDLPTEKGTIECYIYTKNVRRISKLKKGESVIDVKGEFERFFSTLDNYYTKIEIVKCVISFSELPETK